MKRKTVKIMTMLLAAVMMLCTVTVSAEELELVDSKVISADENTADDELAAFYEEADGEAGLNDGAVTFEEDAVDEAAISEENTDVPVVNVIKYNIKFDKNGADCGKMGMLKDCQSGSSYKLPSNKFARAGYKFNGWNTRKNGKGKSFNNKASVKDLTNRAGDTVTLYAQWKKGKKANFILKDSDMGDGAVVTVKNNTKANHKVIIRVVYYQGDQLIGSDTDTCDCLQSKTTCALHTGGITAGSYDSYTVKIERTEKHSKKTKCYVKKAKVSFKKNNNRKRVDVSLSKLDKNIKNAEVAIVFYKNNKVIGYDFWEDSAAFKGKSSYKLNFRYPTVNGKVTVPDKCKVYLNEAYYYSF